MKEKKKGRGTTIDWKRLNMTWVLDWILSQEKRKLEKGPWCS